MMDHVSEEISDSKGKCEDLKAELGRKSSFRLILLKEIQTFRKELADFKSKTVSVSGACLTVLLLVEEQNILIPDYFKSFHWLTFSFFLTFCSECVYSLSFYYIYLHMLI